MMFSQRITRPAAWLGSGLFVLQLVGLDLVGLDTAARLSAQTAADTQPASATSSSQPLPSSLKIVKLLWTAQPAGASSALEKAIDQAITRRELTQLKPALAQLTSQFKLALDKGPADSRWAGSVAALAITEDAAGLKAIGQAVTERVASSPTTPARRELLLRCWQQVQPTVAKEFVLNSLAQCTTDSDAGWLEVVALRGLQADVSSTSESLVSHWSQLPRPVQLSVVEPLTQSPAAMQQLVAAIEAGHIAKDLLNTNQLRKWNASSDTELSAAIGRVWGKMRETEDTNRKEVVAKTLKLLSSGSAGDPVAGQSHFKRICAQCHRLHGEGLDVGPDITGNGRGSFEQMVSNVMDPSLVIGQAFTSKTVLTTDGRVIAGVVAASDDKRLTLKVQGGKLVELDREEDIEQIKDSDKSLMPDGLEQQMSQQELLDLFAYLSLTKPLSAAENDTIPGTPDALHQRN